MKSSIKFDSAQKVKKKKKNKQKAGVLQKKTEEKKIGALLNTKNNSKVNFYFSIFTCQNKHEKDEKEDESSEEEEEDEEVQIEVPPKKITLVNGTKLPLPAVLSKCSILF